MRPATTVRELTARGRGAIRVLELVGRGALERVAKLAPGRRLVSGEFALVRLSDAGGELLDEALVLVESPERVELHLHGAPVLVERVRRELGPAAEPDEPVSLEERAEARLATAASEAAARTLLDQAEGALRSELEHLLTLEGAAFRRLARELARRGRCARWLLEPPRVVLAGPVNAGKSTLFNLLVGRERVLVDAAAGTTRDAVRERIRLGDLAVELFDTAGERDLPADEEEGSIEAAGQALAAELRRAADLVLWLAPPGAPLPPPLHGQRVLRSRADLAPAPPGAPDPPSISVRCAPERACEVVAGVVHAALELPRQAWTPGAGVPFEAEWSARLSTGDAAEIAPAVRAWLVPSSSGR